MTARPRRQRAHRPPGGHRPRKRFSQNFLVDKGICEQIATLVGAGPEDTVLEIGPGTGALTAPLQRRVGSLHAVEVDRELFAQLKVEWSETNVVLHQRDILKSRLEDFVPRGPVIVAGNLPYHITTDLLFWLLREHERIPRAVVMMQQEVARRITAEPGTREAGAVTLALQYRCGADRVLDVPPSAFRPRPKVHSSVVSLRFLPEPAVHPKDEALFFRLIRAGFGQRRKTLVNALAGTLGVERGTVQGWVEQAGLEPKIRGERLTLHDFERLSNVVSEAS